MNPNNRPGQQPLNLWNYKPWWCQPWSIVLTGVLAIAGSWLLLKMIWATLFVTGVIALWWGYFLILLPGLIQRSQVFETERSGSEVVKSDAPD
jgi:hypothetical protein